MITSWEMCLVLQNDLLTKLKAIFSICAVSDNYLIDPDFITFYGRKNFEILTISRQRDF